MWLTYVFCGTDLNDSSKEREANYCINRSALNAQKDKRSTLVF